MIKNKRLLGILAALVANLIFGFSFFFTTTALNSGLNPIALICARFTLAFIILNILWLLGVFKLRFKNKRIGKLLIMALAQPLLYFIFETYGLDLVSSSISGVIISLVPVAVLVGFVVFFKGKPSKTQVIFSIISVLCVIIISIITDSSKIKFSLLGVVLLLLAVLCAAIFNMLSSSESGKFSPFERTYVMFAAATVGFNLISLIMFGKDYFTAFKPVFTSVPVTLSIVYLSIVSSIIAFMLYNFATSAIDLVSAASFSSIIPICSVLAGIFLLGEELSPTLILLCALIIFCVYMVNKSSAKQ